MKKIIVLLLCASCAGSTPTPASQGTGTNVVVFYTSKSGDKVIKELEDSYGYVVWVEDSAGNIKAIARH